jgi:hypothetical protein
MSDQLPPSVRYVKNGESGRWWRVAAANGQIHLGWKNIPCELLLKPDYSKIEHLLRKYFGARKGATQDFNQLRELLDKPSKHVWITFQDGYLWWCTVIDGATANSNTQNDKLGNFWLTCERRWSNRSLDGRLLAISDLPGTVTRTAGFQGTICIPKGWQAILRIIQGHEDADAQNARHARAEYERAVLTMIKSLSPKDFEQLIDLILARTGWIRISTLGKSREGIDVEAENLTANEIAFVQVKSSASQKIVDDYVSRFQERRDYYARMIFAVHSPIGNLSAPGGDRSVQLWTGERLAQLVVRLGLGEWVESKLA